MNDFLDTFVNAYGWAWLLIGAVLVGIFRLIIAVVIELEA